MEKEKRRWKSRQIICARRGKTESLLRVQHHCLVVDKAEGRGKMNGHSKGKYRKEARNKSEEGICGWPLEQVTHVELARICEIGNTTGFDSPPGNGVKSFSTREKEAQHE